MKEWKTKRCKFGTNWNESFRWCCSHEVCCCFLRMSIKTGKNMVKNEMKCFKFCSFLRKIGCWHKRLFGFCNFLKLEGRSVGWWKILNRFEFEMWNETDLVLEDWTQFSWLIQWKFFRLHSIAFREEDIVDEKFVNLDVCGYQIGDVLRREKRVSLTIRKVKKVLKTSIRLWMKQWLWKKTQKINRI